MRMLFVLHTYAHPGTIHVDAFTGSCMVHGDIVFHPLAF